MNAGSPKRCPALNDVGKVRNVTLSVCVDDRFNNRKSYHENWNFTSPMLGVQLLSKNRGVRVLILFHQRSLNTEGTPKTTK